MLNNGILSRDLFDFSTIGIMRWNCAQALSIKFS